MKESVQKKMVSGAAWMLLLMIVDRAIGLVSTLVLVRLLMPEDFGLVAMCTSVIAALEVISAFSFDMVLIQRKHLSRDHYDTAWTLIVGSGSMVSLLVAMSAIPVAQFYGEDRLVLPLLVLAVGYFIRSFENIRVVDFLKNMDFKKEATLRVLQKLIGFSVTIPCAFVLKSYWALVIGIFALNVGRVVLSYVMRPYRPRFCMRERKEIMGFSAWLFLFNLVSFLRLRISDFAIGRISGARSLGLFEVSRDLSSTLVTQIVASLNRALYPGYAKLTGDIGELSRTFLTTLGSLTILAAPIALGIASVAGLLVPVLLGENWIEAIPLLKVLAFVGLLTAVTSNVYYVFNALNKPRLSALINLTQCVFLVPLVIYGTTNFGAIGAGWALVATALIGVPLSLWMVAKNLRIRFVQVVGAIIRPIVAALVMYLVVNRLIMLTGYSDYALLAFCVASGIVAYFTTLGLLAMLFAKQDSVERLLLSRVLDRAFSD